MKPRAGGIPRLLWVALFGTSFGLVEAAVVVYLRALYYPDGFSFPLRVLATGHLGVELAREAATIVMLVAAGVLAGRSAWERFAMLLIAFGSWDITYYAWLRVFLGWPSSLLDWDVLFLIPIPWIGPVIAPAAVAVLMIVAGFLIVRRSDAGGSFTPGKWSWLLGLAGVAAILVSFMLDTNATVGGQFPEPYRYELLAGGLVLMILSFAAAYRARSPHEA